MTAPVTSRSQALFRKAESLIPGGVNSPVRACRAVGGLPRFIAGGKGAQITDADGNELLDFVCSWGPLVFGHAPEGMAEAVAGAAARGTSFGAPTEAEVELAELLTSCFPSLEMVRLVNSGTEAGMSAVRLARGFTGRDVIVKFAGCYHGHADSLLVAAGSGLATFGVPSSQGVPEALARLTLVAPYNDAESLGKIFSARGAEIAAVIAEPVAGNMGVVPPDPGFLQAIASLCDRHGALFICDEVITGFRLGLSGAQGLYGLKPDLTVLGKIAGGGLPLAAFGGRKDVMERLSPLGGVYQAGTLSGNPLAVAAGLHAISRLKAEAPRGLYEGLAARGERWAFGLAGLAARKGVQASVNSVGSMGTLFFTRGPVRDWETASLSDVKLYARFWNLMLERGIYLAPSQFEASFVSTAHTDEDIDFALAMAAESLDAL
ncbi:MAG: glutamate-1-semialdehyde 2,1-aminomutase [Deltaproteobacteria bacterium]|jgi:glutamate-1-semialdehyde 2,1-aminomutase|nr:glutamate-1-semialdehyde 2,1-aminomutase [Deltaproteobacteria bacterium]